MDSLTASAASLMSWARDARAAKKLSKVVGASEFLLLAYWRLIGDDFQVRMPEDWTGRPLRGMKNEVLELLLTRVPPRDRELHDIHDKHLRGYLNKARADTPVDELLYVIAFVEHDILQIILQRLWGTPGKKEDWAYSPMAWRGKLGNRSFSDRVSGLIHEAVSPTAEPVDARESTPYWETLPDDYPDTGMPLRELAFYVFAQFGNYTVRGNELAFMFFDQLPGACKDWEGVVLRVARRIAGMQVVEHDIYRHVIESESPQEALRVQGDVLTCGDRHATLHTNAKKLLSKLPSESGRLLRYEELGLETGSRYEAVRELKKALAKVGFIFEEYWDVVPGSGFTCKSPAPPLLWDDKK